MINKKHVTISSLNGGTLSEDTLQLFSNCGILGIDEETIRQQLEMTIRESVIKNHPYAITQQPSGRWQTYYRASADAKRVCIQRSSKEKVIDKLVDLYKTDRKDQSTTLDMLFLKWIEYKASITDSANTIIRHKQHYKKYLANTSFFQQDIRKLNRLELQSFCNMLVKQHNLTSKEWTNVKTILKGVFSYALAQDIIASDPMPSIRISVKFRQVPRKSGASETFNTEERALLEAYLDAKYEETGDIGFLAVRLNFYLGLRVGELVSLKASDLVEGNNLHIVREEICDKSVNQYRVVDHTKTHQDRFVILVPKALDLLKRIIAVSNGREYLFERQGIRINARQIAYILEKYAEKSGLLAKRSHKIRKTFASTLNANNVPMDEIRKLLGHSNLQTTMAYLYNPLTGSETYDRIAAALG